MCLAAGTHEGMQRKRNRRNRSEVEAATKEVLSGCDNHLMLNGSGLHTPFLSTSALRNFLVGCYSEA